MAFLSSFSPVCWNQVYLTVVGGSVVFSLGHYMLSVNRVIGDIPIHFDYLGRPDGYARKAFFFLYPMIVGSIAAAAYGMSEASSTPVRPTDQVSSRVVLATSCALVCVCQYYAVRISRAEERKMPAEVILASFAIMGSCGVYSLLNGLLNR